MEFADQFTPQFWSIIWATILTILLMLFINKKVKGADPKKTPGYFVLLLENYVTGWDKLINDATSGRLEGSHPYFFALFHFILFNVYISLFGFADSASAIMFALALGLVTFGGIYIVGALSWGTVRYFYYKWKNPINFFTQFSPLLSITVRLFGASFAGAIMLGLIALILEGLGTNAVFLTYIFPWLNIFISQFWMIGFFTIFLGAIHAYIFTMLTMVYWTQEISDDGVKTLREDRKEKKAEKRLKKESKKREKEERVIAKQAQQLQYTK